MPRTFCIALACLLVTHGSSSLAAGTVVQDAAAHTVTMADRDGSLSIRLNYDGACYLDRVTVRGRETVSATTGVCSAIKVAGEWATTRGGIAAPKVTIDGQHVTVEGIQFSSGGVSVRERWHFTVADDHIDWQISRDYLTAGDIEDTYFPGWDFLTMDTWTGALLDTGGVAWGRYLPAGASYGAHAGTVMFFDAKENTNKAACLRITATPSAGATAASRFSHQPSGLFSFAQSVTTGELATKTNLRRFNQSLDIWAPFHVEPGTIETNLSLQVLEGDRVRGRGTFVGLDGKAITNLLDTIGRYGVIDRKIMGGNGWLTGFVCLHEPFFAEMGLAIADPAYTANFAATLDEWRDHGQKPDGRVLSRWHHDTTDNMVPGTYDTKTGLYECGWGYTLDSQPDYVINTSEQFDLTGDIDWLRAHKQSCEKALDWLLAHDSDGNGLVEMLTDTHANKKSSDWIDIVWASWENALVNAEMFEALTLWSDREALLGDAAAAAHYRAAATKLRDAFRRPIAQGGFWNEDKGWFAYWHDRDGSIHGDNLVTPVNFCAVAYGLADDAQAKRILDGIESRMREEKLFHWPLCFLPYAKGEAANETFPDYENGDIFLSWGEVAVRAYAQHDPGIALAYVRRVLERYQQDGLSFQRYLRNDQAGAGDDILAGNCMTIVGLYRDLYGIRPQWNRMRLYPHLTPELEGTRLRYHLRGKQYDITLGMKQSSIAVDGCTVNASGSFAINTTDDQLQFFAGEHDQPAIIVSRGKMNVALTVDAWPDAEDGERRWTIATDDEPAPLKMIVTGLQPQTTYQFQADSKTIATLKTDVEGSIAVEHDGESHIAFSLVKSNR